MKKNILITGATGNLGQSVVAVLSSQGYALYATASRPDDIKALEEQGVQASILDLTQEAEVQAYLDKTGPQTDAAVLLVGGFALGNLEGTDGTMLRDMYRLNFETTYFVVRGLMPHFEAKGKGQFIFIGARPALQANEGKEMVAYSLTKGLLFHLAALVNAEGKDKNISATVLVPGTIDTPRNREGQPEAAYHKWVKPEDIAQTIAFLLGSNGASIRESVIKLYNQS